MFLVISIMRLIYDTSANSLENRFRRAWNIEVIVLNEFGWESAGHNANVFKKTIFCRLQNSRKLLLNLNDGRACSGK